LCAPSDFQTKQIRHWSLMRNAVLTLAVGLQRLQTISRRDPQASELGGRVELKQLTPRDTLDVAEARNRAALKQGLGIGARERANHALF
jgi:hypothetical protein